MCDAHRCGVIAVVWCAVQIVPAVSGFAQPNTGHHAIVALDRTSSTALRAYTGARPGDWPDMVPRNLQPGVYRSMVEQMLERSPTFRRQCWRIANAPELVVTVQKVASQSAPRVRARTKIARSGNQLLAVIEVASIDDSVELIAHEIEHIIEQLDGVNLRARVGIEASGVNLVSDDTAFETTRAKRAGLRVAEEVLRARR